GVMLTVTAVIIAALVSGRTRPPAPAAVAPASARSAAPTLPSAPAPTRRAATSSGLTCLEGTFGDHVEHAHAVGDATAIVAAGRAIYWIDIENTGRPT